MGEARSFQTTIDNKTITIETGKLAGLAGGAVTVRQADTMILATATMGRTPREGIDFFPLTVDYEERLYAGGRIPGSFFRREGRPSESSILVARLVDRPIRPMFPKDMRNDVQILVYSLSSDGETPIDVLAIVGASAALTISDVPFLGPVGGVRVSLVEDRFVLNPTYLETEASPLDLRLAGTRDAILMVECGAQEVSESKMIEALEFGHRGMQPLIELQEQMRKELGKAKASYPSFQVPDPVVDSVRQWIGPRLRQLVEQPLGREQQQDEFLGLKALATTELCGEGGLDAAQVDKAIDSQYKAEVRQRIVKEGKRPDGRGYTDIRPISAETDLSPRAHGSGLFSRGETQVLTLATLGTPRQRQELDGLSPIDEKRYLHHYNFPPFSTGEVRMMRGTSRRDTGHGALAERALVPVLPPIEEFPYTLRLVSEVLSSNGSTSMASVCASTLALLDTGVPIRAPVAGIAMGLIKEDDRYAVLTDIQGVEDHFGDMDFKVAGTRQGITALQMDIKIKGITAEIMAQALDQARQARLFILDKIEAVMPAPRAELKPFVPRLTIIKIDPDKIGAVIGPGGKMIRSIQEETGVQIDIEDDGSVFIAAADGESAARARQLVESLTEVPVVGRIYTGKVVRTTDFGAFVEILPNIDGMVHISQLDSERIEKVEDVARVGDELTVMVTAIDPEGKVRLSRQAVLEGWTAEEAAEHDRPRRSGDSGGRGSGRSGGRSSGSGRPGRGGPRSRS